MNEMAPYGDAYFHALQARIAELESEVARLKALVNHETELRKIATIGLHDQKRQIASLRLEVGMWRGSHEVKVAQIAAVMALHSIDRQYPNLCRCGEQLDECPERAAATTDSA